MFNKTHQLIEGTSESVVVGKVNKKMKHLFGVKGCEKCGLKKCTPKYYNDAPKHYFFTDECERVYVTPNEAKYCSGKKASNLYNSIKDKQVSANLKAQKSTGLALAN